MCHLPTMGQMAHQNTQARRPAEAHRAIPKVGAKTKSDFLRARLLDESFKVIIEDESSEPYLRELGNIITKLRIIGVSYNETVKTLNSYHTVATAPKMIRQLETYSEAIIRLQVQATQLTMAFDNQESK